MTDPAPLVTTYSLEQLQDSGAWLPIRVFDATDDDDARYEAAQILGELVGFPELAKLYVGDWRLTVVTDRFAVHKTNVRVKPRSSTDLHIEGPNIRGVTPLPRGRTS